MNRSALLDFLLYCGREGYATLGDEGMVAEPDGSTSIILERGLWRFHDNYVGGEPYGGREVVFYEGKPVWFMAYYGKVFESVEDIKPLYQFLRKSLSQVPDDAPYRGPRSFKEDNFSYQNEWQGTIEEFSGSEMISLSGEQVYEAHYIGGLVNVR